jgi:hypothetical protein
MQNTKNDKPTSAKRQKPALGKGLDALIPDIDYLEDAVKDYFECEIDRIIPNKYQPRERFSLFLSGIRQEVMSLLPAKGGLEQQSWRVFKKCR